MYDHEGMKTMNRYQTHYHGRCGPRTDESDSASSSSQEWRQADSRGSTPAADFRLYLCASGGDGSRDVS